MVSIPPKIAVATFVGQVKGVASTKLNKSGICPQSFFWQEEYAAFSLDSKRLSQVIAYVERQKQHHAEQTIVALLEQTTDQGTDMIREIPEIYQIPSDESHL